MNQNTINMLLILDAAGAVVTIGFGIAAFIVWRKTKKAAEKARHKANRFLDETQVFLDKLKGLAGDS